MMSKNKFELDYIDFLSGLINSKQKTWLGQENVSLHLFSFGSVNDWIINQSGMVIF